ncbi:hypothetical protein [Herbiconiux ginsengi]|nr:hypothetical protein [Herbiconiux ginsengi]
MKIATKFDPLHDVRHGHLITPPNAAFDRFDGDVSWVIGDGPERRIVGIW